MAWNPPPRPPQPLVAIGFERGFQCGPVDKVGQVDEKAFYMRTPRIYQDTNLTPISMPNPDFVEGGTKPKWIPQFPLWSQLRKLGFEDSFMLYDGTLNRAPVWCNDDFTFKKADALDWDRQGNFAMPPQERAVQMCMQLNNQAGVYQANTKAYNPIVFDLENASVNYTDSPFASLSDPLGREKIENLTKAVQYAKNFSRWAISPPVGHYQYPMPLNNHLTNRQTEQWFIASGLRDLCDVLDFVCPSYYNVNWHHWSLGSPNSWFDAVDLQTKFYDRWCSHLPRMATVTPTFSVYWPEQEQYKKYLPDADKAVPLATWRKQLRYLAERDYDIFLWAGLTRPSSEVYANLVALADMANP